MSGLLQNVQRGLESVAEREGISYGVVFGSAAKGEQYTESDVDVAVKLFGEWPLYAETLSSVPNWPKQLCWSYSSLHTVKYPSHTPGQGRDQQRI